MSGSDVIVITGASSGLGRATALLLAARGSRLVLVARSGAALEEVAGRCRARGGQAQAHVADVTDPEAMLEVADEARDADLAARGDREGRTGCTDGGLHPDERLARPQRRRDVLVAVEVDGLGVEQHGGGVRGDLVRAEEPGDDPVGNAQAAGEEKAAVRAREWGDPGRPCGAARMWSSTTWQVTQPTPSEAMAAEGSWSEAPSGAWQPRQKGKGSRANWRW